MKVTQINPEKLYSSEEITDYLNVSLRTTQRLLKSAELPSFKINGQYRIKGIDVLNYLNGVRLDNNNLIEDENIDKPSNLINLLEISPIEIKISTNLAKIIQENEQILLEQTKLLREKIVLEMGFICPGIRFSDDTKLTENKINILINGVKVFSDTTETLDGIFSKAENIIKKYAYEIISREEVFVIIQKLRKNYPVIVDDVLAEDFNDTNKLNIGEITKIIKKLLKEKISIRNMRGILETISDTIPYTRNIDEITNKVRESLSRQICEYLANDEIIEVIGLETELEKYFMDNISIEIDDSKSLNISSDKNKYFMEKLIELNKEHKIKAIICNTKIRALLRNIIERNFPDISVISYREIAKEYKVKLITTI